MPGAPWKTSVHFLPMRKEETQSTIYDGMFLESRRDRSLDALTLSKPAFMSRKRVDTFRRGLWRVLAQLLSGLFYFFYFIFIFISCIHCYGTRTRMQRLLWRKQNYTTGVREKAIYPSSSGLEPTAHQPHQIRKPPLTSRSGKKRKIK